jgi:oligopeptide/dipeptide ABC transporter ATP-binding protein
MTATEPLLSVRGLSTSFATPHGSVTVLDDVDLDVGQGESLGIVGESGSGKSLMFLSVLGLVKPPGHVAARIISFDGHDLSVSLASRSGRLRADGMALIMQDALTALNPALTIGTQIGEALARHAGLKRASEQRGRAEELLRLVGIPDPRRRLDAYPHELSGGQRQRAMIAAALACGPKLLVADEPTTALDVTVQAQVLDLIAEMRERLGMSLVLITHNLGIVAEYCERVAVVYAGEIVETGPAAEVIAEPRHPYTVGLMAALPRLDRLDAAIAPIPGRVPDPSERKPGCRFAERCSLRSAPCAQPQSLRQAGPGRLARCHLVS